MIFRNRRPACRPKTRRAATAALVILSVLASTSTAWSQSAMGDPEGDTIDGSDSPVDLIYLAARTAEDPGDAALVIDLAFAGDVSTSSSEEPHAVHGFVDLDVDGSAATGQTALADFLTGTASELGGDYYVDLLSYQTGDGLADLISAGGEMAGRVPLTWSRRSLSVRVPSTLLGASGGVHVAAVVGHPAAVTDRAPNVGFVESGESAEEVRLNGERFAVEVTYRDFQDQTGSGRLVFRSDDSAVFWFFAESNWELMLKVLDACGLNQRYWVFIAATTNVEYTVRVTDTLSGAIRVYTNPLGQAAPAITDTDAFTGCS